MPDLTLYEDDVELIRDALTAYKRTLRDKATQRIVDDSAYEEIQTCERLGDLLLDRLVQRLHPKRDVELQVEQDALKSKVDFVLNVRRSSP